MGLLVSKKRQAQITASHVSRAQLAGNPVSKHCSIASIDYWFCTALISAAWLRVHALRVHGYARTLCIHTTPMFGHDTRVHTEGCAITLAPYEET